MVALNPAVWAFFKCPSKTLNTLCILKYPSPYTSLSQTVGTLRLLQCHNAHCSCDTFFKVSLSSFDAWMNTMPVIFFSFHYSKHFIVLPSDIIPLEMDRLCYLYRWAHTLLSFSCVTACQWQTLDLIHSASALTEVRRGFLWSSNSWLLANSQRNSNNFYS